MKNARNGKSRERSNQNKQEDKGKTMGNPWKVPVPCVPKGEI